jgi:hypothetical protein
MMMCVEMDWMLMTEKANETWFITRYHVNKIKLLRDNTAQFQWLVKYITKSEFTKNSVTSAPLIFIKSRESFAAHPLVTKVAYY